MKVRSKARSLSLQALFEIDMSNHPMGKVLDTRLVESSLPLAGESFVRQLVIGVTEYCELIDGWIAHHAPERPVNQLAAVDRNILRISLFELAGGSDAPVKVVINEAVELAKRFGSESSPRFINGVLGSFVEAGSWPKIPTLEQDRAATAVVLEQKN